VFCSFGISDAFLYEYEFPSYQLIFSDYKWLQKSFDDDNELIRKNTIKTICSRNTKDYIRYCKFDEQGNIVTLIDSIKKEQDYKEEYFYNNNKIDSIIVNDSTIVFYMYKDNLLVSNIVINEDGDSSIYKYTYDKEGNVLFIESKNPLLQSSKRRYIYRDTTITVLDANNNEIEYFVLNKEGQVLVNKKDSSYTAYFDYIGNKYVLATQIYHLKNAYINSMFHYVDKVISEYYVRQIRDYTTGYSYISCKKNEKGLIQQKKISVYEYGVKESTIYNYRYEYY
jgi:hypothetical protein